MNCFRRFSTSKGTYRLGSKSAESEVAIAATHYTLVPPSGPPPIYKYKENGTTIVHPEETSENETNYQKKTTAPQPPVLVTPEPVVSTAQPSLSITIKPRNPDTVNSITKPLVSATGDGRLPLTITSATQTVAPPIQVTRKSKPKEPVTSLTQPSIPLTPEQQERITLTAATQTSTPVNSPPKPSEPATPEPRPSGPATPEPRPSEPATAEPRPSEPATAEPRPSEPAIPEPQPSDSTIPEPRPSEPAISEPQSPLPESDPETDPIQAEPKKDGAQRREGIKSQKEDATKPVDIKARVHEKSKEDQDQIETAIMDNDFLKNVMDEERVKIAINAMTSKTLSQNSYIIREGETGSHLYVSAQGTFEVIKDGKIVKTFGPGVAFGELAILYKAKRFASVRVTTAAKVWVLERSVFRQIMIQTGRQEQQENVRFLKSVPLLNDVHPIEITKISDLLKREFYATNTVIIRQGEPGDKFYIIRGGSVAVSKSSFPGAPMKEIGKLHRGDYFGEQALLHEDKRLATIIAEAPGVECLTLDRIAFTTFLGNIDEIKRKYYPTQPVPEITTQSYANGSLYDFIQLGSLDIVRTLGFGGFGRVELVQYREDKSLTFALKCLKKHDMVEQGQQEHAFNEKEIMFSCDNNFICKLYKTYRNKKYLYFLMELCLGGDVFTLLQKEKFLNEKAARFMSACVIEAFDYLHTNGMIYRDLKPENLMLDDRGYIKLVDFGFAKRLSNGNKTWTFAGTPEYVAPEIILNKGHDRAVDYWALGIFIHELLVGRPPFRGADNMKTYNLILKGIDEVTFSQKVGKKAQMLIKKLCRSVATDRLGYQKNGVQDIKNHNWFMGFEWDQLRKQTMVAPLVLPVTSNTDTRNFDKCSKDLDVPPDEYSGWDNNF